MNGQDKTGPARSILAALTIHPFCTVQIVMGRFGKTLRRSGKLQPSAALVARHEAQRDAQARLFAIKDQLLYQYGPPSSGTVIPLTDPLVVEFQEIARSHTFERHTMEYLLSAIGLSTRHAVNL